jgi:F-type H+-transporting ATPase subunit a
MNAMDMLPVDLLPVLWQGATGDHHAYLRVVPYGRPVDHAGSVLGRADSVPVYSVKIKGLGGWAHELVTAPFGTSKNPVFALILGVVNLCHADH